MVEKTSIEWTQSTWNPVTGCIKLSAGCDYCYAERFSERFRGVVFLHPFGMHGPWSTIAELGRTGAIEVFINFPDGMAIQRLLKRSGEFSSKERVRFDDCFGNDEWYNMRYKLDSGLFGEPVTSDKQGQQR